MLLRLLRFLVLAATVASGLVLVVKPESVSGFTGLAPDAARGITEIRAAMGGVFIALGVAPLFLRRPAERVLGLVYLAIAAVRAPFMFADGSAAEQLERICPRYWLRTHCRWNSDGAARTSGSIPGPTGCSGNSQFSKAAGLISSRSRDCAACQQCPSIQRSSLPVQAPTAMAAPNSAGAPTKPTKTYAKPSVIRLLGKRRTPATLGQNRRGPRPRTSGPFQQPDPFLSLKRKFFVKSGRCRKK